MCYSQDPVQGPLSTVPRQTRSGLCFTHRSTILLALFRSNIDISRLPDSCCPENSWKSVLSLFNSCSTSVWQHTRVSFEAIFLDLYSDSVNSTKIAKEYFWMSCTPPLPAVGSLMPQIDKWVNWTIWVSEQLVWSPKVVASSGITESARRIFAARSRFLESQVFHSTW